jgi:hypothetical protein
VVPTLTFERLFAFLVLGHGRRQLLWFEVTRHPTAEWLARQITEAFPWASAPTYLARDNGNPHGNRHHTRHLLNQKFLQALLLDFEAHGREAIEECRKQSALGYVKVLGHLVPREHKVGSNSG